MSFDKKPSTQKAPPNPIPNTANLSQNKPTPT